MLELQVVKQTGGNDSETPKILFVYCDYADAGFISLLRTKILSRI